MTASLLPNGQIQFTTEAGVPVAGGYCYTYTPGTTTFNTTWQDSAQTILNLNPIPLDAGGRCTLYGSGTYRLLVLDSTGATVEDTTTTDTLAAIGQIPYSVDSGAANGIVAASFSPSFSSLNAGQTFNVLIAHTTTGVATIKVAGFGTYSVVTTGGQGIAKNDLLAGTIASFCFTGTAVELQSPNNGTLTFGNGITSTGTSTSAVGNTNPNIPSTRVTEMTSCRSIVVAQGTTSLNSNIVEVGGNFGLISNIGSGTGHEAVGLYSGVEVESGSGDAYAFEASLTLDSGATEHYTLNAFGAQILFTNNDRDLPISGASGFGTGLRISGTPTVGCSGSFGLIFVNGLPTTALFHVGLAFEPGTAGDIAVLDNSGATRGLALYGGAAQAYKIDCAPANSAIGTSAWDLRCANAKGIVSSNVAGNADLGLISLSAADNVVLGNNTSSFVQVETNLAPARDNNYACGVNGARWTSVWAVNGTIQTSDAREKRSIAPSDLGLGFILRLKPVAFQWINGLDHETHYGLCAQDLEKVLDGRSFGGLQRPEGPDGRYGLCYDELIGPLIRAVQEQQVQIEALKAQIRRQWWKWW